MNPALTYCLGRLNSKLQGAVSYLTAIELETSATIYLFFKVDTMDLNLILAWQIFNEGYSRSNGFLACLWRILLTSVRRPSLKVSYTNPWFGATGGIRIERPSWAKGVKAFIFFSFCSWLWIWLVASPVCLDFPAVMGLQPEFVSQNKAIFTEVVFCHGILSQQQNNKDK